MNNLNPEERRAKADEIARLLENEPLLASDLGAILKAPTLHILKQEHTRLSGRVHSSYLAGGHFASCDR